MALSVDTPRWYEGGEPPVMQDYGIAANTVVYEGGALTISTAEVATPLIVGGIFVGFADKGVSNNPGAAGAKKVRVRSKGQIYLTVVGVTAATDVGTAVYALDDGTFTLTPTSAQQIGKYLRHAGSSVATECIVYFEADSLRSI